MRPTYTFNLLFLAICVAALILPRLVPRGDGFAPSAVAALVLLVTLLSAVIVAAAQAVYTWRRRAMLARHEHWLGYAPLVLGASGFLGLLLFLRS